MHLVAIAFKKKDIKWEGRSPYSNTHPKEKQPIAIEKLEKIGIFEHVKGKGENSA